MKELPRPTAASFKLFGNTIQLSSAVRSSGNTTVSRTITQTTIQEPTTKELDAVESDQDSWPSSSRSIHTGRNEPVSVRSESRNQQEEAEPGKEEESPDGRPVISRWLPCPRCDSSDTKFCYFNNYNMNQPRHFCRKCQRYWTDGGNQRNLPIGSGRRKRKTKRDDVARAEILSGLYGSPSSSSSSSSPSTFVMSSSVSYGARELDVEGLSGLRVWPNATRNPP